MASGELVYLPVLNFCSLAEIMVLMIILLFGMPWNSSMQLLLRLQSLLFGTKFCLEKFAQDVQEIRLHRVI